MVVGMGGDNSVEVEVRSEGINDFTGSMDRAIGSMFSFRGAAIALGGALATAAAGGILYAVGAAREWNTAMRELTKVTDPEAAERIGRSMVELSETIPLASESLAQIATDAARFGIAEEQVASFTETVAMMAFATDLSVDEAGRSFAKLSSLTQTPIEDIDRLGSSINLLGQTSATSTAEIVDNMLRSSAALSGLGATAPEIVGIAASLNEVSESSERAGTRLRRVAEVLQDPAELRAIAEAISSIEEAQSLLSGSASTVQMAVFAEREELRALERQAYETDEAINELADRQDEYGDRAREVQLQIMEIRQRAAEENRELTASEEEQIRRLEVAQGRLRLERERAAIELDDLRETREEQSEAIDQQSAAVERAVDAFADEFGQLARDDPAEFITRLAEAMAEGGPVADALASEFDSVAEQALRALGSNEDLRQNIQNANGEWQTAESLLREFEIEVNSTGAQMQFLRSEIDNAAATTGQTFLPAIVDAVKFLRDGADAFQEFNEGTEGAAGQLALLSGLLGGIAIAVGGISVPVLALIGAVGALAVAWQTNFGNIQLRTSETFTQIQELWNIHGVPMFNSMMDLLAQIEVFWQEWGDEIAMVTEIVFSAISALVVTNMDGILTAINIVLDLLTGDWEGAWDHLVGFVFRTFDRLVGFLQNVGPIIVDAATGLLENMMNAYMRNLNNFYRMFVQAFYDMGWEAATRLVDALNRVLPDELSSRLGLSGGLGSKPELNIPDLFEIPERPDPDGSITRAMEGLLASSARGVDAEDAFDMEQLREFQMTRNAGAPDPAEEVAEGVADGVSEGIPDFGGVSADDFVSPERGGSQIREEGLYIENLNITALNDEQGRQAARSFAQELRSFCFNSGSVA